MGKQRNDKSCGMESRNEKVLGVQSNESQGLKRKARREAEGQVTLNEFRQGMEERS
jgi:hypothetical protein